MRVQKLVNNLATISGEVHAVRTTLVLRIGRNLNRLNLSHAHRALGQCLGLKNTNLKKDITRNPLWPRPHSAKFSYPLLLQMGYHEYIAHDE